VRVAVAPHCAGSAAVDGNPTRRLGAQSASTFDEKTAFDHELSFLLPGGTRQERR